MNTTTDALEIRYTHNGYLIMQANGVIIEHGIPFPEAAEARRQYHADRIAALRAWDDAHRRDA